MQIHPSKTMIIFLLFEFSFVCCFSLHWVFYEQQMLI